MGEIADALECRNAGLFRLRELDDELRSMPDHPVGTREYADLMDERECLCEALAEMNAEPWPFDSEVDRSWMV